MIDLSEVRNAADTLARTFEEYKGTNDQRLAELERRGSTDVLLDEKLGRMDKHINRLQDDITNVKTALRRPHKAEGAYRVEEGHSEYKQAFMRYITKGFDQDLSSLQRKTGLEV